MIETTNNIIFYLGYGLSICLLILAILWIAFFIYRFLLEIPTVAIRFYNKQIEETLSKTSQEDFDRWVERLTKLYKECNNNGNI